MDIQVSSNFERLLFELKGRDGAAVAAAMRAFRADRHAAGGRRRPGARRAACSPATGSTMRRRWRTIAETYRRTGDADRPAHRGRASPRRGRELRREPRAAPMVALATAHPAKFPDAVERATGIRPAAAAGARRLFEQARADRPCCPTISAR